MSLPSIDGHLLEYKRYMLLADYLKVLEAQRSKQNGATYFSTPIRPLSFFWTMLPQPRMLPIVGVTQFPAFAGQMQLTRALRHFGWLSNEFILWSGSTGTNWITQWNCNRVQQPMGSSRCGCMDM